MSRTPIFNNGRSVAAALTKLVAGEPLTYDHTQRLIASGHVEVAGKTSTDAVKVAGRGRHKIMYQPSKKGKAILSLSKTWK